MRSAIFALLVSLVFLMGCGDDDGAFPVPPDGLSVDGSASRARSSGGESIYWRERLIDAREVNGGIEIRGGDGLAVGDLDGDGFSDVVSVHEDSGHLRVAFASPSPATWRLLTLADRGVDGIEDVVLGDFDGDGDSDVVVACEKGHLAYFANPGGGAARDAKMWALVIPPLTRGRGSFIRVSAGDFDGDGRLDLAAANKGLVLAEAGQELEPSRETILAVLGADPTPISIFTLGGEPLSGNWTEHELGRFRVPVSSRAIDLDGDGDLDVVGGGRGELRGLLWFENLGHVPDGFPDFATHLVTLDQASAEKIGGEGELVLLSGQTLELHDFNRDDRVDILTGFTISSFGWLEQPADPRDAWRAHVVGDLAPDHHAGMTVADIDGDGHDDIMVGGYSKGDRESDLGAEVDHPLGRIAWYRAPADPTATWTRHDVSRRTRGMFDDFVARDVDGDGDLDFIGTRGNSVPYGGVFWLEQRRLAGEVRNFVPARNAESDPQPLPEPD